MISSFYGSIFDDEEKRILNVSETRCLQQIKVLKPRFAHGYLNARCLINFRLRRLILVERRLCINNDVKGGKSFISNVKLELQLGKYLLSGKSLNRS